METPVVTVDQVRAAVAKAGSQPKLAKAIGVKSYQTVHHWLKTGRVPWWHAQKIIDYLNAA